VIEFVLYVLAVVDVVAVLLAALTLGVLYAVKGVRTACRALRRRCTGRRAARLSSDPTVILQRLDQEFSHITPQYFNQLANSYLIPGEDFR
jgi:hypothetical protein